VQNGQQVGQRSRQRKEEQAAGCGKVARQDGQQRSQANGGKAQQGKGTGDEQSQKDDTHGNACPMNQSNQHPNEHERTREREWKRQRQHKATQGQDCLFHR